MTVNGETKLLGLIGNPVRHTMSPVIHNSISESMRNNAVYVPFEVKEDLGAAVKGAYALGITGMNVTVPYKSEVIEHLVDIDELAGKIGAVNTLVRVEGGYKGYNTDILGLERSLIEDNVSLNGKNVLMLGAGGAARAVAFLCVKLKAKSLTILNRTVSKAETLAKDTIAYAKEKGHSFTVNVMNLDDHKKLKGKGYIVFQCTKIGLKEDDGAPIMDDSFYKKVDAGVDLIYRENTEFQVRVRKACNRSYTGLKMLLYQGVIAYELFMDTTVDEETIEKVKGIL